MARLRTEPNVEGVDDVYERLVAMHEGWSLADSLKLSTRLNLILVNHVGDRAASDQASALAGRRTTREAEPPVDRGEPS